MSTIIFLLFITVYQSGVMTVNGYGQPIDACEKSIVSSPESAAVVLWEKNQGGEFFRTHYSGELYRIDITAGKIEKIAIPKVTFNKEAL